MDLPTFQRRALAYWHAIPTRFREGVTALVIDPEVGTQDTSLGTEEIYGCCASDEVAEALGVDEVRSRITLFYGSFALFASEDPAFDWQAELEETIRHELEHHLGARSGHDPRADEDAAEHEHERMLEGVPFTPGYHRAGTPLGDGGWLLSDDLIVEVEVPHKRWASLVADGWRQPWQELTLVAPPAPPDAIDDDWLYVDAEVDVPDGVALPWNGCVLALRRVRSWWPW